jgi:hypothetical protein
VSRDLGITPVEPEVAEIVLGAARRFEDAGVIVEDAHPDLGEAHECFQTLRALSFAVSLGPVYETHRDCSSPRSCGTSRRAWRSPPPTSCAPSTSAPPCSTVGWRFSKPTTCCCARPPS